MTTDTREAERLEARAALLERQADDRESAVPMSRGGGRYAIAELDRADEYRAEARDLRRRAAALRRERR